MIDKITSDFLRPFSPDQVSQLMTYAMEMATYGLSAAEVVEMCQSYMDDLAHQHAEAEAAGPPEPPVEGNPAATHGPLCPECGATTTPQPVNVSKCTAIGGDWKSVLMCDNEACRWTDLSTLTVAEILGNG